MYIDACADVHHCQSYGSVVVPRHKHHWQMRVVVEAEPDQKIISRERLLSVVLSRLHHFNGFLLNDIYPFNAIKPSHENIAAYFFHLLDDTLEKNNLRLKEMRISEDQEVIMRINSRDPKLDQALQKAARSQNARQSA